MVVVGGGSVTSSQPAICVYCILPIWPLETFSGGGGVCDIQICLNHKMAALPLPLGAQTINGLRTKRVLLLVLSLTLTVLSSEAVHRNCPSCAKLTLRTVAV